MNDACHLEVKESSVDFTQLTSDYTAYFSVQGLGCRNCVMIRVKNSLLSMPGVHMVSVSLQEGIAGIVYNPKLNSQTDFENAFFEAGDDGRHHYNARLPRVIESPTYLNDWE